MDRKEIKLSLLEFLIFKRSRAQGCKSFTDPVEVELKDIIDHTLVKIRDQLLNEANELSGWNITVDDQSFPVIKKVTFKTPAKQAKRTTPKTRENLLAIIDCQTKFMEVAVKDLKRQTIREGRPKITIIKNGVIRHLEDGDLEYHTTSKSRIAMLYKIYEQKIVPGRDLYSSTAEYKAQSLSRKIADLNGNFKKKLKTEIKLIIPVKGGYSLNHEHLDIKLDPAN